MAIIELEVSQMIVFSQDDTRTNPSAAIAGNTIVFTDYAKNYQQFRILTDFLHLSQSAIGRKSIYHISASNYFEIHESGRRSAGHHEVTQYLILSSLAKVVEFEESEQTIELGQSVTVHRTKGAKNTLVITQVATPSLNRTRAITQTLILHSNGVCYMENENWFSIETPTLNGPNKPEVG